MINVGTELINDCYDKYSEEKAIKIIELTEQSLFELSNNDEISSGPRVFEDILINTMDYAEKAFKKSEEVRGLRSGLIDFDKKLRLHKSDLIIIAGRPSMGKTVFATNIAYNITKSFKELEKAKNIIFFLKCHRNNLQLELSLKLQGSHLKISEPVIYQKLILIS